MTDIHIPPEALEAGARALARGIETEDYWPYYKNDARAAFLAMVEAWPGMWPDRFDGLDTICLPQEKPDGE